MNLEEANGRLRTTQITEEQLWRLNSLYLVLDLDKDDFCKIVDAVGVEKLLDRQRHFERLDKAEQELSAKEKYLGAKRKLDDLRIEKERLEEIVLAYKTFNESEMSRNEYLQ